jgi:hypothetical protein
MFEAICYNNKAVETNHSKYFDSLWEVEEWILYHTKVNETVHLMHRYHRTGNWYALKVFKGMTEVN